MGMMLLKRHVVDITREINSIGGFYVCCNKKKETKKEGLNKRSADDCWEAFQWCYEEKILMLL